MFTMFIIWDLLVFAVPNCASVTSAVGSGRNLLSGYHFCNTRINIHKYRFFFHTLLDLFLDSTSLVLKCTHSLRVWFILLKTLCFKNILRLDFYVSLCHFLRERHLSSWFVLYSSAAIGLHSQGVTKHFNATVRCQYSGVETEEV